MRVGPRMFAGPCSPAVACVLTAFVDAAAATSEQAGWAWCTAAAAAVGTVDRCVGGAAAAGDRVLVSRISPRANRASNSKTWVQLAASTYVGSHPSSWPTAQCWWALAARAAEGAGRWPGAMRVGPRMFAGPCSPAVACVLTAFVDAAAATWRAGRMGLVHRGSRSRRHRRPQRRWWHHRSSQSHHPCRQR